ncbi:pyridoxal phosphate-dependent decarboxylase family protein [Pedobacter lusitanus]|nr:aminotransferase class V-fold PLP-dependent enzyme [Pedobacter lusitanus]
MEESVNLNSTLDPKDWSSMRSMGHEMIDDIMDYLEGIRTKPVWQEIPAAVKDSFQSPVPQKPSTIEEVYHEFKTNIFPYTKGNIHPRFFAWVQGTGTPFGVLAEMLSAAMNPNVTIGEHAPMYVDQQVVNWCKQIMNYPESATGILLSGASMANITALNVARNSQLKLNIRKTGVKAVPGQLVLYCSAETHSCIQKAAEVLGLGTDAVRKIKTNSDYQININELVKAIEADLAEGFYPFCVVGNAGTVNTGAIDPLDELAAVCLKYNLWFHIDGAFGALAKLVPAYSARLKAIEKADSVAFDLHKWMYMPYEIACVLIKDNHAHRSSFAVTPEYLLQQERGLAGGPDPVNNYGMELSRSFKALKVWMSLKEHGLEKYAEVINKNILQAFYLEKLVQQADNLELLCPVNLNIVCFRYVHQGLSVNDLEELNKEIIIQLQEQGIASPSSTILNGIYAIRVCIVNQRTLQADLDLLIEEIIRIGDQLIVSLNFAL